MRLAPRSLAGLAGCLALAVFATVAAQPASPPSAPILRIEAAMHGSVIYRIAVDRDERYVATASSDKTVRVWDLASGRLLSTLRPPQGANQEGRMDAVAMSPDGETIAAGGWSCWEWDRLACIYVFSRASGKLIRRIAGLSMVPKHLAWSPDGRFLVATLAGNHGVRLIRTSDFTIVGTDRSYGGDSYGADFDARGRLATVSYDGFIRTYRISDAGLEPLATVKAPGGERPFTIRFAPDGSRAVVTYDDVRRVDVLSAERMELLYSPNITGVTGVNLFASAWSADGSRLYAGGRYTPGGRSTIRAWSDGGRGAYAEYAVARDTVMHILPLKRGGFVFGAADPAWGVHDAAGLPVRQVAASIADFRDNRAAFLINHNASTVAFSYQQDGKRLAQFNLEQRHLGPPDAQAPLSVALDEAAGLKVEGWRNSQKPSVNGRPLKLELYEESRSVATARDGQSFLLGTSWNLYRFDAQGTSLWRRPVPATAWQVNLNASARIAVAALSDGTIRWYSYADGKELLAFFPHADGRRWVLWTPSGYYEATPGAEELIGWHLNRGREDAADFFPVSRFRDRYNRPEVIARVLETLDENEAVRVASAETGRRVEAPVRVDQVLPPVVEIRSPDDGGTAVSPSLAMRFIVRTPSDAPATAVRVRVNGQPVEALGVARAIERVRDNTEAELTVQIPREDSEVSIFAENRHGVSVPARVRLTYRGPREDFAVKPKLYVLAVGVGAYRREQLRLRYPGKDARDFAAVLGKQKGLLYRDVEVKLLTDAAATRDDVLDGLEWLRRQVTAKDIGVMFLAGHGDFDPDGRYFFLPVDADPDRLRRTAVVYSEIRDTLSALPGKAVFFVDTCHAGSALGAARRSGPPDITRVVNELASAENGVLVFSSSTGRQFSLEHDDWQNGAFTKAVVEGLAGAADFQKSGRVTHKMLDFYISERVKTLTQNRQTPVTVAPQGAADFPLAVIPR